MLPFRKNQVFQMKKSRMLITTCLTALQDQILINNYLDLNDEKKFLKNYQML